MTQVCQILRYSSTNSIARKKLFRGKLVHLAFSFWDVIFCQSFWRQFFHAHQMFFVIARPATEIGIKYVIKYKSLSVFLVKMFILQWEADGSLKGWEGSVWLTSLYQLIQISYFSYWLYETTYLNEEVNCTDPSLSTRVPCNKLPADSFFLTQPLSISNIGKNVYSTMRDSWFHVFCSKASWPKAISLTHQWSSNGFTSVFVLI